MDAAVVVLSGGQDSTTCLYWARGLFQKVYALTFDYGQRHRSEIYAAREIALDAGVAELKVVTLEALNELSPSALTRHAQEVKEYGGHQNLPSTFTPGRNLVFMTLAASWAVSLGIDSLITGVCQTDFSGYPDCRRNTMDALEKAIALGNDLKSFKIHTPLMWMTKAETVRLARELGDDCWRALGGTVTCYHGHRPACGKCPACRLRAKGFEEAGLSDPALA